MPFQHTQSGVLMQPSLVFSLIVRASWSTHSQARCHTSGAMCRYKHINFLYNPSLHTSGATKHINFLRNPSLMRERARITSCW